MVADLRLLASDLVNAQINIPQVQVGSSIMPGKINPVIPEFVISAAHKVYANDVLVSSLSAQGCLELNAYLPTIGHAMLDSVNLLVNANKTLNENFFTGLVVNHESSREKLFRSPSITTALVPLIGYHKASELAKYMKTSGKDIFNANHELKIVDPDRLQKLLETENLLKLCFVLSDLE